ncbi:PIG-L deacetylase family protein [Tenggerimyces flavus]|uniref:PIG-L deacetylase family protein n=1 Tax=Tenggerimyces flavus TaxID=1708749 RepID=A0ABV7Y374_9ACTN|nr:PIG-L deacetylase family protein [Tenggerimyces flavus]MBM7790923.1 LmbE family N-acetylglucosaminyl deacetylase [Tenggerimyces flavus]
MKRDSEPAPDLLPADEVSRVLVVTAHPDDVDFGCAGTVATWTAAGIKVEYCVVTDGQAGGFDPALDRAEIPRIRRLEQAAAASVVGVSDLHFLGYVDGELTPALPLVRDLTRVIRQVRPDRMVIQSPERDWSTVGRSHPDHLAAGEAAYRAVYPAARNPFAFPELAAEGLEPWTVREVWVSGHPTYNHAVDVTETFELKLAAVLEHTSQHPSPDAIRPRLTEAFGRVARSFDLGDGHLAEPFFVARTG